VIAVGSASSNRMCTRLVGLCLILAPLIASALPAGETTHPTHPDALILSEPGHEIGFADPDIESYAQFVFRIVRMRVARDMNWDDLLARLDETDLKWLVERTALLPAHDPLRLFGYEVLMQYDQVGGARDALEYLRSSALYSEVKKLRWQIRYSWLRHQPAQSDENYNLMLVVRVRIASMEPSSRERLEVGLVQLIAAEQQFFEPQFLLLYVALVDPALARTIASSVWTRQLTREYTDALQYPSFYWSMMTSLACAGGASVDWGSLGGVLDPYFLSLALSPEEASAYKALADESLERYKE